jgi:hypothetical protein
MIYSFQKAYKDTSFMCTFLILPHICLQLPFQLSAFVRASICNRLRTYTSFIFHGLECIFHGLEHTFHGVEYKMEQAEKRNIPIRSKEYPVHISKKFNREDVTQEITEEIDNDLTTEDKSATEKINSSRRPPLNYFEMGMKKGDILVFVKDSSTEVSVVNEKKVMYQGDVYSLTGITKKLLNITHAIQPTGYWMFEGKSLRDIYDETYTLDD